MGETQFNSTWLTQNINTNGIAGIQLSEAKKALETNAAAKAVLENYKNMPSGQDPTIEPETLAKMINEASLSQPIHINTHSGLVAVLDGSVIPDIATQGASPEKTSSRSIAVPGTGEEAKNSAPSDKPTAKGALATIEDVSKAFRKDTPEEIKDKATNGTLTKDEAKMWATTTSKEGRALLGISGRMDAADKEILAKQHFARKAAEKGAETSATATVEAEKKGLFRKAADTAIWPFRKTWEGIKKGWNWVTGRKGPDLKEPANVTPSVTKEPEAAPEPEPKPAEPPSKTKSDTTQFTRKNFPDLDAQPINDRGKELNNHTGSARTIIRSIPETIEDDKIAELLYEAQDNLQLATSTIYGSDIEGMFGEDLPDLSKIDEDTYKAALEHAKAAEQKALEAKELFDLQGK